MNSCFFYKSIGIGYIPGVPFICLLHTFNACDSYFPVMVIIAMTKSAYRLQGLLLAYDPGRESIMAGKAWQQVAGAESWEHSSVAQREQREQMGSEKRLQILKPTPNIWLPLWKPLLTRIPEPPPMAQTTRTMGESPISATI